MAVHNKDDRPDELAADYVLGVLSERERAEVETRIKTDALFAAKIADWQIRLEPLLDKVAPVTAPKGNLDAIWDKIDPQSEQGQSGQIIQLRQHVKRWRRAALAAGAIAAALVFYVATAQLLPRWFTPADANFVAILQSSDKTAHFVASVDLKSGRIDILRMGPVPTSGKTYELWAVGGGRDKPQSLGLVTAAGSLRVDLLKKSSANLLRNTVLAVSLEPAGGSPSGQPTGPVLFTGKLVPFAAQ